MLWFICLITDLHSNSILIEGVCVDVGLPFFVMSECILQLSIKVSKVAVMKQPDLYESMDDDPLTVRNRDAMIGSLRCKLIDNQLIIALLGLLATLNMIPSSELTRVRKRHHLNLSQSQQSLSTTPSMR